MLQEEQWKARKRIVCPLQVPASHHMNHNSAGDAQFPEEDAFILGHEKRFSNCFMAWIFRDLLLALTLLG